MNTYAMVVDGDRVHIHTQACPTVHDARGAGRDVQTIDTMTRYSMIYLGTDGLYEDTGQGQLVRLPHSWRS